MKRPFILSPAGSYDALVSAVNAGADEVYFGMSEFNARYNAKNFTREEMKNAINMCRILGVNTNITVNTLVTDKELPRVLDAVYDAACLGADAFIVQDLGLARAVKREMPQVVLHASTQCACHNKEGAEQLSELGFSRVVLAREMPMEEIRRVTELGIETEIFVHGALCVCHSGMCLMSSVIGSRSGNRGLCAQPCRLPYSLSGSHNSYPLSLKDLSLAQHIEDILGLGVTSLKIEGRMKSPEYVYGTTKIWRELLDGEKNADKRKMQELESIFSRQGFTDKYFTGDYTDNNSDMYGTRREQDKKNTRDAERNTRTDEMERKRSITLTCSIAEGEKAYVTAEAGDVRVSVESDFVCPTASSLPLDEQQVKTALSKLGSTLFEASSEAVDVRVSGNVFLSKSMLNSLRRDAIAALEANLCTQKNVERNKQTAEFTRRERVQKAKNFLSAKNVHMALDADFADYISLPLYDFDGNEQLVEKVKENCKQIGVALPRVVYSGEMQECRRLLAKAKSSGAMFCVVSNIGQVKTAKDLGFRLFGGMGMNVFNSDTVKVLEELGFELVTVSPELNEAQIRDLSKDTDTLLCGFVKGRLPVMVLESCIIKANGKCRGDCGEACGVLKDRIGKEFEVYGERRLGKSQKSCRNIIYNSVETNRTSLEKTDKMNLDVQLFTV